MTSHAFETTYESLDHLDNVTGSAEVRIYYEFDPGSSHHSCYQGPDDWPRYVELQKVEEEFGAGNWKMATEFITSWAENFIEEQEDEFVARALEELKKEEIP